MTRTILKLKFGSTKILILCRITEIWKKINHIKNGDFILHNNNVEKLVKNNNGSINNQIANLFFYFK